MNCHSLSVPRCAWPQLIPRYVYPEEIGQECQLQVKKKKKRFLQETFGCVYFTVLHDISHKNIKIP